MAQVQCDYTIHSTVSEIRLRVGQFMDEIMKHPHAIIDRLCVRL
ncbi:hypothetical protein [Paenibacillus larvae]|nr:hypothetical protein [Paenibacillus larvae]MDT2194732.1 hypothetical protein [Paenibacillus larvae]